MKRRFLACTVVLVLAENLTGCGAPGAPAPPSLNLPAAVTDLSAARTGDDVELTWTMPKRTTDRIPLRLPVATEVCRAVEAGACIPIASLKLAPGAAGTYTDKLPRDLTASPERLLRYEVILRNHAGKAAGPASPAYSAAGSSPPAVEGLHATVRQEGVLLGWQAASEPGRSLEIRIERLLLTPAAAGSESRKSALATAPTPALVTLAVHEAKGEDPGHALDSNALFNERYRYTVRRVVEFLLGGETIKVDGPASEPVEVATKDIFPPAVPAGLAAVADFSGGAIDLSWYPDADPDLAGYHLYRRDLKAGEPAAAIASLGEETSYRDTGVQAGHTYAYSVSAVDQSGNQSSRSAEVTETLPSR